MPKTSKSQPKPWIPAKKPFEGRGLTRANTDFYNSPVWRKMRKSFMMDNPLCAECERNGRIEAGTVCDHIRRIEDGGARFDPDNLQALCETCHNRKSALEGHERRWRKGENPNL